MAQDASRLVFVSVKDAKPKRKVAVPIGDGATWEQFCGQVRRRAPTMRRGVRCPATACWWTARIPKQDAPQRRCSCCLQPVRARRRWPARAEAGALSLQADPLASAAATAAPLHPLRLHHSRPLPTAPQVQAKLKLVGIEAVYLASSGERVTALDQLQDIDELHVVEASFFCLFVVFLCLSFCIALQLGGLWRAGVRLGQLQRQTRAACGGGECPSGWAGVCFRRAGAQQQHAARQCS